MSNDRKIATLDCWKKTSLGSAIELVSSARLEDLRVAEHPIILMGGIHGDEPEGVQLARETLRWLKKATEGKKQLAPWIVIPCLNIDGLANKMRVNGRGVDLNRNYPSQNWSPKFDKERYFPGASPASEPEIAGVVELIQSLKPRLLIHCHSWKPCIVGTGETSKLDTQRLSRCSGYNGVDDIGYPTPGSLSEYGWHDLKIPVICIEEQENLTDLSPIWPRFEKGMEEIFSDLSLRQDKNARGEE